MSFATEAAKSVNDARVLVQLDIGSLNVQWVNWGAGLWAVNADNAYSWVDSSLLDGFTAQNFAAIGSVQVDGSLQTNAGAMADLASQTESFYYDADSATLWVHLINNDEPWLHDITIGVVYGYSYNGFTPSGTNLHYEGRLLGAPSISKRRDPLYFGKLVFAGGSIRLANGDGYFDEWAEDNDIYGNEVRVYLGYASLDYADYQRLYTGYIERVSVDEETISVQIADKRKQLTAPITYVCTAQNALSAISAILASAYSTPYTSTYYDLTAWASAAACAETVTINMQTPDSVINVIEGICASIFGVFYVDAENRYSFRLVDTSASSETTIPAADIMTAHRITYDPTEVISSARIGHSRDWATTGTQYSYVENTTYEQSVYNAYKTYNQRTFDTWLDNATAATAFGETIMQYSKDVHGTFDVEVPMTYYARDVGETMDAVINRARVAMLGTKKSEILEVRYNLDRPTIVFGLRIV